MVLEERGAVPVECHVLDWLCDDARDHELIACIIGDRAIGIANEQVSRTVVVPIEDVEPHPRGAAGDWSAQYHRR